MLINLNLHLLDDSDAPCNPYTISSFMCKIELEKGFDNNNKVYSLWQP